jgi:hypothetical protein
MLEQTRGERGRILNVGRVLVLKNPPAATAGEGDSEAQIHGRLQPMARAWQMLCCHVIDMHFETSLAEFFTGIV